MNYDRGDEFTFLVNEVKKLNLKDRRRTRYDGQESYEIVSVRKEQIGMDKLMGPIMKRQKINMDDVIYCFNSHQSGYFLTKSGALFQLNLLSKKDDDYYYSSSILREYPIIKDVNVERPVSASILPNGCAIEYFDNVVLYQNSKSSVIEKTPSITVRSFVNSYRYKNIVAVTKEDECTFHSVDTLDLIRTTPTIKFYGTEKQSGLYKAFPDINYESDGTGNDDLPF